jgi:hypothetical protein
VRPASQSSRHIRLSPHARRRRSASRPGTLRWGIRRGAAPLKAPRRRAFGQRRRGAGRARCAAQPEARAQPPPPRRAASPTAAPAITAPLAPYAGPQRAGVPAQPSTRRRTRSG